MRFNSARCPAALTLRAITARSGTRREPHAFIAAFDVRPRPGTPTQEDSGFPAWGAVRVRAVTVAQSLAQTAVVAGTERPYAAGTKQPIVNHERELDLAASTVTH